jgi:hypothetical protein
MGCLQQSKTFLKDCLQKYLELGFFLEWDYFQFKKTKNAKKSSTFLDF